MSLYGGMDHIGIIARDRKLRAKMKEDMKNPVIRTIVKSVLDDMEANPRLSTDDKVGLIGKDSDGYSYAMCYLEGVNYHGYYLKGRLNPKLNDTNPKLTKKEVRRYLDILDKGLLG